MCAATACTSQPGRSVGRAPLVGRDLLQQVEEVVDRLPPDVDVPRQPFPIGHGRQPSAAARRRRRGRLPLGGSARAGGPASIRRRTASRSSRRGSNASTHQVAPDLGVGQRPVVARAASVRAHTSASKAFLARPSARRASRITSQAVASSAGDGSGELRPQRHDAVVPSPPAAAAAGSATSPRPRPGCAAARCVALQLHVGHPVRRPLVADGPSSSSSRRSSSSDSSSTAARSRAGAGSPTGAKSTSSPLPTPEHEPPAGQPVEAGELARDLPRPPPRQRHHQRSEPDPAGRHRDRRQRHGRVRDPAPERVLEHVVPAEERRPSPPPRPPARARRWCGRRSRRRSARHTAVLRVPATAAA